MDRVFQLAAERPVVVFSKSTCCMCHTINTLFFDFGVNPTVYELDHIPGGREIEQALARHGVAGRSSTHWLDTVLPMIFLWCSSAGTLLVAPMRS
ncbi:unnamed protein product [Linum tenue]|uniref:Glutaredoxin domain-containing protein n=1 Tax=Linum tenue TaxID=586396 RepID=A0AAV0P6D4_9ROSI|nr:unnamed protein product [Linum tenue]